MNCMVILGMVNFIFLQVPNHIDGGATMCDSFLGTLIKLTQVLL